MTAQSPPLPLARDLPPLFPAREAAEDVEIAALCARFTAVAPAEPASSSPV